MKIHIKNKNNKSEMGIELLHTIIDRLHLIVTHHPISQQSKPNTYSSS